VTRFLGGSLRGVLSRVIDTPGVKSNSNGVAVSRDGCTLLVSDAHGGSHGIHELDAIDGSQRRVVGSEGDGPLQFVCPSQVWIAPDDHVFVVDCSNHRVQVLTPALDFHSFVGVGYVRTSAGVRANADVVVVSETLAHRISVFNRRDGALLRQFGSFDSGDDCQLSYPQGVCFMSDHRRIVVADWSNHRVSMFSVDGEFIRHVGVGVLKRPQGVACSVFDELVVADSLNRRVAVFSDVGELLMTFGDGDFTGVAVHGSTVFAQDFLSRGCVVWS
jgi:DNA-binding beta-propeller fold protein YncE